LASFGYRGQWHPGDIRVVVARPSAPDAAALVTSREIPALAWTTQTSHEEEIEPVMAGVTEALGQRLAEPGEEYRPLRTARRALELVTGARAPVGEAEVALVRSLPQDRIARLLVASTRDDEGPGLVATVRRAVSGRRHLVPNLTNPLVLLTLQRRIN
jgi:hypothetical protein